MSKLIGYQELQGIKDDAKKIFSTQKTPLFVENKQLEFVDLTHVAVVESMIRYLNRNNLLNTEVKINYSDLSNDLDSLD